MPWATFILLATSGYVAYHLILFSNKQESLKFLGLTIATCIFFLMQIFVLVDYYEVQLSVSQLANIVIEWGHITCMAFILSSLAVFIRDSKPVFAQFPMAYTALPLLIIISYVLVKDTYAIKNWLLTIYQGGALTVSLLMYSVYTYRRSDFGLILTGVVLFLISHILYWYVPVIDMNYSWLWKLLIAMAMVLLLKGFKKVEGMIPIRKENNF